MVKHVLISEHVEYWCLCKQRSQEQCSLHDICGVMGLVKSIIVMGSKWTISLRVGGGSWRHQTCTVVKTSQHTTRLHASGEVVGLVKSIIAKGSEWTLSLHKGAGLTPLET